MKTIQPSNLTPAQRLATVRGIVEGTHPTGRVLRTIPVQKFRAAAAPVPKWIAHSSNAQALAALNLIARYPVTYRPAWLRMVIQSHFKIHGEEYYEEAKSTRAIVEQTLLLVGKRPTAAPDPVAQLALANQVLATRKRTKKVVLKPAPTALNLELKLG